MKRKVYGFSLVELMIAVAIAAILVAVAVVGYQQYTTRAAAADLVSAHHNIRTGVLAQSDKSSDDCTALAGALDRKLLNDPHASMDYAFVSAGSGYRPVLRVCAVAGGPGNVAVVKRAYESFAGMGVAEQDKSLTDSSASFLVRLTDGDKALCSKNPPASSPCGQTAPAATVQASAQPAQAPAQPAQPPVCPTGQVRNASGTCVAPAATVQASAQPAQAPAQPAQPPACPTGQVRNARGTCVAPADLLPPVPQPRTQPPPVVTTAATCPAGQEKVLITSGTQAQSACAPTCQAGERRNTAGLCIKDVPPTPPAWAAANPNPGTPPQPAPPGKSPTCPSGTTLVTAFVQGALSNTCVKACGATEILDGAGQCVPRCKAPLTWDTALSQCIDTTNPPACPSGMARKAGATTCSCNSGELAPDGTCRLECKDAYGPTCAQDFGDMCTEDYVREMCVRYCTKCTGDWIAVAETRGEGTKPTMPYFAPSMAGMLPQTPGEPLVLDDQALARVFGVTSPDGSPISVTGLTLEIPQSIAGMFTAERRADGRWVIGVTGDTSKVVATGRDWSVTACDFLVRMNLTFTNASGSTQAGWSGATCHR